MEKRLLNVKEVCKYLGISRATLYKLIKEGNLKPVKIGSSIRFDIKDIEEFIERNKEQNKQ